MTAHRPSEFDLLGRKRTQAESLTPGAAFDEFVAIRKGKLIINPIYKKVRENERGIRFRRKRQYLPWELENTAMMKAMPHEVELPAAVLNDLRHNTITEALIPYVKRCVVIEVPHNFF